MSAITITELAELCGVAVSTVSRAMNNRAGISPQTRDRILEIARRTGYVPNTAAKNLKISSTRSVAVVMQGWTSELLTRILDSIRDHLADARLDVYPVHVTDREASTATITRLMTERRLAGLVFLGRYGDRSLPQDSGFAEYLADVDVPVIFCTTKGLDVEAGNHASVSVDDRSGAFELTKHLLDLGHRGIAFGPVSAGFSLESDHAWALRYQGYRDALIQAGIAPDPNWLIPSADPIEIYTMANGYNSIHTWLGHSAAPGRVTAIVTTCDAAGLGAMRAAHDRGLSVPGDISVTGFDGLEFGRYCVPSLTTVVQPTEEIANQTSRFLIQAITGKTQALSPLSIRGELLVSESTAPAPQ